ncbi:MAG TPA: SGNH/GDSL hydrolase family protein [Candidatus Acidoferrales bacterium]|nr:SGNH/GDSL hydrolase family protein [Candidatus Acidoferrales bacterium]
MKIKFHVTILQAACFAIIIQLSSCAPFITKTEPTNTGIIDADNPNIQYIGRFDFLNPKKVAFDWAGVYICAKFTGTGCSLRLHDSTDEYAIIIDDHAPRLLTTDNAEVYHLVSGLADSVPHTIMIQKRTEPLVGRGTFMGFVLDKGATLLPPDRRPDRRIEFIGNSITSGYGVMADSSNCHFTPQTEDACMSYASITARELHADYHLISYSGRGVVRNYGDKNKTSVNPMPALYDRICYSDSTSTWDFTKWVPQAVVINLGTNDFSTEPHPDSTVFEEAYCRLIDRVRVLYPGVTIFCVTGPMIGEPCTRYVRELVKAQQEKETGDRDVFFIEIPRSMMNDNDWGCELHPNVYGANKMAGIVVPMIKLRMNW